VSTEGLIAGADGRPRCWWPGADPLLTRYHDEEWGRPLADDRRLFEKICLEGFQSGLSWRTILQKRENFRAAFADFDPAVVARFGPADVERCLADAGIVRHRGKTESVVNNARRMLEFVEEAGSLAAFVWRYEPPAASRPTHLDHATLMQLSRSAESIALSKALRKRGWSFVGPVTIYAFMQSAGLVNDHLTGCAVRETVEAERRAFERRT
jgi:DNA-3-methyladenine glycosylase I